MAVNQNNVEGTFDTFTPGDGIDITGGVITNTMSPPSIVLDNSITNPATVTDFSASYIVPAGATGAWAGQANNLATSTDSGATWTFTAPTTGMRRQVTGGPNAGATYRWTGTAWVVVVSTSPVGAVLKITAFDTAGVVVSGPNTSYTLTLASYTPVSSSSYLLVTFGVDYDISGSNADEWRARILVAGTAIMEQRQRMRAGAGEAMRSAALAPIHGRYTNASAAAKSITCVIDRVAGDDTIILYNRYAQIVEIQR